MGWMCGCRGISLVFATIALLAGGAVAQEGGGFASFLAEIAPESPVEVGIGVKVMQITEVDQKAENFSAVARLLLEWSDPKLVQDPETAPAMRTMGARDFVTLARSRGLVTPTYIFENQQERSFTKYSAVGITRGSDALHAREEILTLQAPDFDFRKYPFDTQTFYVRVLATAPVEFIQFRAIEQYSGMGDKLGEEEWIVREVWTEVDTVEGATGLESARFSLGFSADRHLLYYWVRIFLPLMLLVGVSWANLFLEEYRRRIDIAGANLLAFIAFNFTISGELPRLGYMTFLDALLMAMFLLSGLTIAYNVALRRMSVAGREDQARAIDRHMVHWLYPLIFILAVVLLWWLFLV